MRLTAFISATLHVAVFVIAWIGVIPMSHPDITPVRVIEVEVMTELEKPAPKPKTVAKQKPKPPPPPPPRREPPPKPQVAEKPEPVPTPTPQAAPIPKPKPKPKAKKQPKAKPKKVAQRPRPRPKSKPKPPPKHDFSSVLKTVKKLKRKPLPKKTKPKPKAKKEKTSPLQQVADALKRKQSKNRFKLAQAGISAGHIDEIRRQIERCWSLPAGARDADKMVVEIKATIGPDGRVQSAMIIDRTRAINDRFFKSMAESAVRAMLNPKCQPLKLPMETYHEWRNMTLTFYPGEMF